MIFNIVDFPEPLVPMMPTVSPFFTLNEISLSAKTVSYTHLGIFRFHAPDGAGSSKTHQSSLPVRPAVRSYNDAALLQDVYKRQGPHLPCR